jgi:hypothetical protein
MAIAPPETREEWVADETIEVLIREARRRARRRRALVFGALTAVVLGVLVLVAGGRGALLRSSSDIANSDRVTSLALVPCTVAQLRGGLIGTTGGAGTFVELFAVENVSSHSCTVSGYSKLAFFSQSGARVAQPVGYQRSVYGKIGFNRKGSLPTVALAAHQGVASFWITEGDLQGNGTACHQYETITVQPPHAVGSLSIALQANRGIFACTRVTVLPMMPGISGSLPRQNLNEWFGAPGPTSDSWGPGLPVPQASS